MPSTTTPTPDALDHDVYGPLVKFLIGLVFSKVRQGSVEGIEFGLQVIENSRLDLKNPSPTIIGGILGLEELCKYALAKLTKPSAIVTREVREPPEPPYMEHDGLSCCRTFYRKMTATPSKI